MQYLPSKPIKWGIKIWMQCDAESAYLHQFNIYLIWEQNSANGLEYDVVMKLCHEIVNKNHCIYFDNLFTSVPLMNDLLQQNTYACGTVHLNKRHLPDAVKWPGRMVHGAHKSYQYGNTNLVATIWQDNKTVRVFSTNSNPRNVLEKSHRIGQDVDQINQPENVNLCNKNMNAVDWHDQLQLQYPVGQFSKKSWKYLLWFLVNASIVNAYILYQKTSNKTNKTEIFPPWLPLRCCTWIDCWVLIS